MPNPPDNEPEVPRSCVLLITSGDERWIVLRLNDCVRLLLHSSVRLPDAYLRRAVARSVDSLRKLGGEAPVALEVGFPRQPMVHELLMLAMKGNPAAFLADIKRELARCPRGGALTVGEETALAHTGT